MKHLNRKQREKAVLYGLVQLHIETGRPVGSQSLKDKGFNDLSSATIRNYFAQLEKHGFLHQQHTSGGRVPTAKAYREYVQNILDEGTKPLDLIQPKELQKESNAITHLLHSFAESLSKETSCAVFLSSPRFDQDFIQKIKLFPLNDSSILAIIITDFGLVHTETLYITSSVTQKEIEQLEQFFLWRMNKGEKIHISNDRLLALAKHLYNEIIIRHVVSYSNFFSEDIYTTGLSQLFNYSEFTNPATLADSLSLFENGTQMHALLSSCIKKNDLTLWIGDELAAFACCAANSSVLTIPYHIQQIPVGAFGILGPMRIDYKRLIPTLQAYSQWASDILTKTVYKFKITFREPSDAKNQGSTFITNRSILLEDKSHQE